MEKELRDFIGKAEYDKEGQIIWGKNKGGLQMIANIRGWGAIQYLFEDRKEAGKFQDFMGQFIAESINEKLDKIK